MSGNGKKHEPVMSHDPLADLGGAPEPALVPEPESPVAETPPPAEAQAKEPEPEPVLQQVAEPAAASDSALMLDDALTIPDVAEVLERFRSSMDMGGALKINGAALEQLDAAGIQLICAAVKDARSQSMEVVWEGVSDHLRTSATLLGLASDLGI